MATLIVTVTDTTSLLADLSLNNYAPILHITNIGDKQCTIDNEPIVDDLYGITLEGTGSGEVIGDEYVFDVPNPLRKFAIHGKCLSGEETTLAVTYF